METVRCQDRGGREGEIKNEAQAFGSVTSVAGGTIHQDGKLKRGAGLGWAWGRAEFGFGLLSVRWKYPIGQIQLTGENKGLELEGINLEVICSFLCISQ